MANKKQPTEGKVDTKITVLDNAAKKLISTIDPGYIEREILSDKDARIQSIINSELDLAKGISGGSIIDFVNSMAKSSVKKNGQDENDFDAATMFTEDIGNIFGYFQELYKNRYVELADLKYITKFIPAIGEAVKTTLDSIVSSDDLSSSITRNLIFNGSLTDQERASIEAEIHRIEKDEKILKKLKNTVYNKTLVSGNHYAYTIPYNELFAEYDRLLKSGKLVDNAIVNDAMAKNATSRKNKSKGFNLKQAMESVSGSLDLIVAEESYTTENILGAFDGEDFTSVDLSNIKKAVETNLSEIYTNTSPVLTEALEGFSSVEIMKNDLSNYRDIFGGNAILEVPEAVNDGTFDPESPSKFSTRGSYIKYIDASKMVPIKVYNQTIGYFHVHDMSASKKFKAFSTGNAETNMLANSSNIFSSVNLTEEKKEKAVKSIVDTITDGILTNFSSTFVNKNAEFKKMIGDCIVSNGLINNAYQIQFIPAKYVVAFTINENEEGFGQSILQDALFPAKMLLQLIVSKLLLYMNKGGNKTIAYIRKGPINVNSNNHTQRVIRMLQEADLTFSDLLSTNLSFQKFSRNGSIQIPLAKNGDRLVDFETQEGQDVDMNTPMEDFLMKLAIMGTGVPSVIMEYTDAADYAKSIVSGQIKFAGRVASMQSDLEEATTDFYKKLLSASNLSDELKNKALSQFEFKLCRPRVLSNANMADFLSQTESVSNSLAALFIGNDDETPEDKDVRRTFIKNVASNLLPFIDWDSYSELLKSARVEVMAKKNLNPNPGDAGDGEEESY